MKIIRVHEKWVIQFCPNNENYVERTSSPRRLDVSTEHHVFQAKRREFFIVSFRCFICPNHYRCHITVSELPRSLIPES